MYIVPAVQVALSGASLDLTRYSGHNFKFGAATSAAAAGFPDSLIETLGR